MAKKKEDYTELLNELFDSGYATEIVDVIPGKLTATIKTLGGADQIQIEDEMASVKGNGPFVLHTYSIKLLSATLMTYGNNEFKERKEVIEFIERTKLSSTIIDKLAKKQNLLEKKVRSALQMEEIDKVFSEAAPQPNEQKPSPKE